MEKSPQFKVALPPYRLGVEDNKEDQSTWMVVVFPIQVFGHVIKNLDGSGFSHPNFLDSSSFFHPTFFTVVF